MNQQRINLFQIVQDFAKRFDLKCYLVGGYLRDQLLDCASVDRDFSLDRGVVEIVPRLAEHLNSDLVIYPEFLTASIKLNDQLQSKYQLSNLDFCQFRKEVYPTPGSLPQITNGDFTSDLARRDFSINTLAIELGDYLDASSDWQTKIIDRHSGLKDLGSKLISVLHEKSFLDDPTRIFRAVRYKYLISGEYQEQTASLLSKAILAGALQSIESYRIANELQILARSPFANKIFIELVKLGIFANILQSTDSRAPNLSEQLEEVPVELNSEDRLINFITRIVLAYQAEGQIKKLGLKSKLTREIIKEVSHVKN